MTNVHILHMIFHVKYILFLFVSKLRLDEYKKKKIHFTQNA